MNGYTGALFFPSIFAPYSGITTQGSISVYLLKFHAICFFKSMVYAFFFATKKNITVNRILYPLSFKSVYYFLTATITISHNSKKLCRLSRRNVPTSTRTRNSWWNHLTIFRSFLPLNDTSVSSVQWKLARPDIIADIVKLIRSKIISESYLSAVSMVRGTAWNIFLFFSRS